MVGFNGLQGISITGLTASGGDFAAPFAMEVVFVGSTISRAADGVVTITTVGGGGGSISVEDDGVPVVAAAAILDFTGNGTVVTDGGGGIARISVDGGVALSLDQDPPIGFFNTLDFSSFNFDISDEGGGLAEIQSLFGAVNIEQDGVPQGFAARTFNFVGAGVSVASSPGITVDVTIPGGASSILISRVSTPNSITATSETVSWGVEDIDELDGFDLGADDTIFTVPVALDGQKIRIVLFLDATSITGSLETLVNISGLQLAGMITDVRSTRSRVTISTRAIEVVTGDVISILVQSNDSAYDFDAESYMQIEGPL